MHDIKQLLEQARAIMTCPVCGRHYDVKEIKFKGYLDHTFILQTSCAKEHAPVFTTWITSYAPTVLEDIVPLQPDHIIDLHKALQKFDGNFKALWSKN